MNTEEIKNAIEKYEIYHNGLSHINGAHVKVLNIKVQKRARLITSDVIIVRDMEGVSSERINDCKYPFDILGVK